MAPPNRKSSRPGRSGGSGASRGGSSGGGRGRGPRPSGPPSGGNSGGNRGSSQRPAAAPNLSVVHARNVAISVHGMISHIIDTRRPADRELASFFRKNKKCGSRDRRLISEAMYSVFRWWGWLSPRGRDLDQLWDMPSEDSAEFAPWLRVLLGAHLLDNVGDPHPVALRWRDMLQDLGEQITHIDCVADRPLNARGEYISEIFEMPHRNWRDLAPPWFFQHLPLEKDAQYQLIEDLQTRPPIWLRVQTGPVADVVRDLKQAGLNPMVSDHIPNAICLEQARVNLFELESFRTGLFEVQDLASQCIGLACDAKPGERWWDVCAGAGGKSLQLGAIMQGKGVVVSTDVREWKLEDLKKRARRSQLHNITTRYFSGKGIPAKTANFDGVLVDAPCTCTGTWRRNPDARWTSVASDISEMAELQYEILCNAAQGVKPGGSLVYATCSVTDAESEEVITRFITEHPEYELAKLKHPLDGSKVNGMYRVWPQQANCDATYVCRMTRKK